MEVFDEPDEEEERQISQYIDVVDSPRVSQNESEYQRRSSESVCSSSSSGLQEDKESLCSICMEVWTNGGVVRLPAAPCLVLGISTTITMFMLDYRMEWF